MIKILFRHLKKISNFVQTVTVDSKIGCEREMRLYSLCFIIHLLAAETNSEQIQIHGTTLCDTKEAEQAIKELHDDLDDDDDGTISTTGNFINRRV